MGSNTCNIHNYWNPVGLDKFIGSISILFLDIIKEIRNKLKQARCTCSNT